MTPPSKRRRLQDNLGDVVHDNKTAIMWQDIQDATRGYSHMISQIWHLVKTKKLEKSKKKGGNSDKNMGIPPSCNRMSFISQDVHS